LENQLVWGERNPRTIKRKSKGGKNQVATPLKEIKEHFPGGKSSLPPVENGPPGASKTPFRKIKPKE